MKSDTGLGPLLADAAGRGARVGGTAIVAGPPRPRWLFLVGITQSAVIVRMSLEQCYVIAG